MRVSPGIDAGPNVTAWGRLSALGRALRSRPLVSRLLSSASWSLADAVATRGLGLPASILAARLLGVQSFGEWGMIVSTVGLVGPLATLQGGLMATKFVAEWRVAAPDKAGAYAGTGLAVAAVGGAVLAILLAGAAPWVATQLLGSGSLAVPLALGGLMVVLGAVAGTQTGILAGFEAFRSMTVCSVLSGVAALPLVFLGARSAGILGLVLATATAQTVACMARQVAIQRECRRHGTRLGILTNRAELRGALLGFALPSTAASMISAPLTWASTALLARQSSGFVELGIYNAANQWRQAVLLVPSSLASAALPIISSLSRQATSQRKVMWLSAGLSGLMALAVAAPAAALAPWLLSAYGSGFRRGTLSLGVLALAGVFAAVGNAFAQTLVSQSRMWLVLGQHAMGGIVLLGTSLLLIPTLGGLGLAIATLVAASVTCLWQLERAVRSLARTGGTPVS